MGPEDPHFINAYRDWGPKEPMDKLKEQARFLAASDAGVGVSDQHAQVLLDYVNTRGGIPLPKKLKTCWNNMKRVHESMCGTLQKVLPNLIRTSLSINVSILCVAYRNCKNGLVAFGAASSDNVVPRVSMVDGACVISDDLRKPTRDLLEKIAIGRLEKSPNYDHGWDLMTSRALIHTCLQNYLALMEQISLPVARQKFASGSAQ